MNLLDILTSSETASLKVLKQGSGTFLVPATATIVRVVTTIPHNFGSDKLIWQVGLNAEFVGLGLTTGIITPWASGDGRSRFSAYLDETNLYIEGYAGTAGDPTVDTNVTYYYRILVP